MKENETNRDLLEKEYLNFESINFCKMLSEDVELKKNIALPLMELMFECDNDKELNLCIRLLNRGKE